MTVIRRDGAVFRGDLVENVPRQYVVVRLSTGEHRRVAWSDITRLTTGKLERSASADLVRVDFRSDEPRARLQRSTVSGNWVDVCAAPCGEALSNKNLYRVGGQGLRGSRPFQLPTSSRKVSIETDDIGTKSQATGGAVLAIAGGGVAYVGLIMFFIGSAPGSDFEDDGERRELTDQEREDLRKAGGVMLIGGGVAGVVGLVLLLDNSTEVTLSSAGPAPHGGPRYGFSLPVAPGLSLTERGFAF